MAISRDILIRLMLLPRCNAKKKGFPLGISSVHSSQTVFIPPLPLKKSLIPPSQYYSSNPECSYADCFG